MSAGSHLSFIEAELDSIQVHVELLLVDTPERIVEIIAMNDVDWFIARAQLLRAGFIVQQRLPDAFQKHAPTPR